MAVSRNTAKLSGGGYLKERWVEILDNKKTTDNRTGDEIAADFIKRAGLVPKVGE